VDDQVFNISALKSILRFKLKVNPDSIDEALHGLEALN